MIGVYLESRRTGERYEVVDYRPGRVLLEPDASDESAYWEPLSAIAADFEVVGKRAPARTEEEVRRQLDRGGNRAFAVAYAKRELQREEDARKIGADPVLLREDRGWRRVYSEDDDRPGGSGWPAFHGIPR
jgi:hypothetical protein